MNPWKFLLVLILFCGGSMAVAECIENRCTINRPPTRTPPSALVRIVNKNTQTDGGFRLDKGSGVLVRYKNGNSVLTASHIFRDGVGEITVATLDGRTLSAKLLLRNEPWDVVVLHVNFDFDIPSVTLASQPAASGEPTVAWGFGPDGRPLGQHGTAVGYVQTKKSATHEILKTTGRAREGDSGGPVLNARGELVGLLWGTDGQHTYSTYSGRLRTILDETFVDNSGDDKSVPRPKNEYPERNEPSRLEPLQNLIATLYALSQVKSIRSAAAVLGLGTPTCFALYVLTRLLRRGIKTKKTTSTTAVVLNDAYAEQLNSLYELSGHSAAADATLGRLYDIKLRDAEDSSSAEMSRVAKMIREQVAEQFLRIHSSNPAPVETNN